MKSARATVTGVKLSTAAVAAVKLRLCTVEEFQSVNKMVNDNVRDIQPVPYQCCSFTYFARCLKDAELEARFQVAGRVTLLRVSYPL